MRMRGDDQIQLRDAVSREHLAHAIGRLRRTGVNEHGLALRGEDEEAIALSDVERDDRQSPRLRG